MVDRKVKFRDGLVKFCENQYQIDFGQLSDVQRGAGFLLFYIREILSKKNVGVFPDDIDELKEHLTDGANDQSCDFIYSYDDHHYIIQGKYRSRSKPEEEGEVIKFLTVLERLHYEYGKDYKKNGRVLDAISNIDYKKDKFSLLFISLGTSNNDIRSHEQRGIQDVSACNDLKDISTRSDFQFLDEIDLNKEYRDILNGIELRNVQLNSLKDENGNYWYKYSDNDNLTSYLTSISSSQVYEIYERDRIALFNLNIRQHLGDNSTNKGIMDTARKEPSNFFFFNNGISAIAKNIEEDLKNGKLYCNEFSIINGAQTFRSIHKIYNDEVKKSNNIKNLQVMIRITEMPNLYKNDGFIDKVTRFNNTQNVVKVSDFRSNDKVQISLNQYFTKIHDIDGKSYFYKNKRTGERAKTNTKIIQLDDFTRKIHAFRKGPIDCYGGQSHLYDTSENGGYFYLYGDEETKEISEGLNDNTLDFYASIYFLCEEAEILFKEEKIMRIKRESDRNEGTDKPIISTSAFKSKYHLYYLIGIFFKEFARLDNKTIQDFLLSHNFSKPKAWKKKTFIIDNILKTLVSISCDVWYSEYKKSYDKGGINHRNWLRTKSHLSSLEDEILNSRLSDINKLYSLFN